MVELVIPAQAAVFVIPAKAESSVFNHPWIPACAGMTTVVAAS